MSWNSGSCAYTPLRIHPACHRQLSQSCLYSHVDSTDPTLTFNRIGNRPFYSPLFVLTAIDYRHRLWKQVTWKSWLNSLSLKILCFRHRGKFSFKKLSKYFDAKKSRLKFQELNFFFSLRFRFDDILRVVWVCDSSTPAYMATNNIKEVLNIFKE